MSIKSYIKLGIFKRIIIYISQKKNIVDMDGLDKGCNITSFQDSPLAFKCIALSAHINDLQAF